MIVSIHHEVYENEVALKAHRATDRLKKYLPATAPMVAERDVRAMTAVAFHANGH